MIPDTSALNIKTVYHVSNQAIKKDVQYFCGKTTKFANLQNIHPVACFPYIKSVLRTACSM